MRVPNGCTVHRVMFHEMALKSVSRFAGTNRFSGSVPETYFKLSQLEYLDLGLCD